MNDALDDLGCEVCDVEQPVKALTAFIGSGRRISEGSLRMLEHGSAHGYRFLQQRDELAIGLGSIVIGCAQHELHILAMPDAHGWSFQLQ